MFKLTNFIKRFKEASESFRFRNVSSRGINVLNDAAYSSRKIVEEEAELEEKHITTVIIITFFQNHS